MIKNLIENFETHIDPKDPAIIFRCCYHNSSRKRTQKTKDKLKTIAGRVLNR